MTLVEPPGVGPTDRSASSEDDTDREDEPMDDTRRSRRAALRLAAGAAAATLGWVRAADAAPVTQPKDGADSPTGGLRPGPLGLGPAPVVRPRGVRPVGLRIDKAGVDAPIEYLQIVDGVMM